MKEIDRDGQVKHFNSIAWHDSELMSVSLVKSDVSFELSITIDLFEQCDGGGFEKQIRNLTFLNCRVINIDLDLLGVKLCGGSIANAYAEHDPIPTEAETRDKVRYFDLPQNRLPFETCIAFTIEMIPPGGIITIFAQTFVIE